MSIESPLPRRVYYAPLRAKLWCYFVLFLDVGGIFFSGVVMIQAITAPSLENISALCFAIPVLSFFISAPIGGLRNRIELSLEGVTYYNSGIRMYTPWQNVTGICEVRLPYFDNYVKAFKLEHDALLNVSIAEGKRRGVAVLKSTWWLHARYRKALPGYIPLDLVIRSQPDWNSSEFEEYLRRYAPQVGGYHE